MKVVLLALIMCLSTPLYAYSEKALEKHLEPILPYNYTHFEKIGDNTARFKKIFDNQCKDFIVTLKKEWGADYAYSGITFIGNCTKK